jgi:hypothetical protein
MDVPANSTLAAVGDRLAIRELIDADAPCADRRLPEQQADLDKEMPYARRRHPPPRRRGRAH